MPRLSVYLSVVHLTISFQVRMKVRQRQEADMEVKGVFIRQKRRSNKDLDEAAKSVTNLFHMALFATLAFFDASPQQYFC